MRTIFTLGFQTLSLVDFIRLVKEQDIIRVVDIRGAEMVSSGRGRFTPKQLQDILTNINVDYHQLPEAGEPTEIMKHSRDNGHNADLIKEYKNNLLSNKVVLKKIRNLFSDDRVLILCFEDNFEICIRKPFTEIIKTVIDEKLKIRNLTKKDLKPLVIPPPEPPPPKG